MNRSRPGQEIVAGLFRVNFAVILFSLAWAGPVSGQWTTATFELKPGWNAIFSHVDATHTNLTALIAADPSSPILEVWRWNPPLTHQFIDNPQSPVEGADWLSWVRTEANPVLQNFVGDSAYLVRVGTNVSTYTWRVKGRPVPPRHRWHINGLNLLGFSTVTNTPPNFDTFLIQSPDLEEAAQIFKYVGGNLSTNNPTDITSLFHRRLTPVKRGEAFWIRSGNLFNRYFGPFEVELARDRGIEFGDHLNTYRFRLRNLTSSNLIVTGRWINSEAAPLGEEPVVSAPPLLVRAGLNPTNFTYGYSNLLLNGTHSWSLSPKGRQGSEVEVVLGLNRSTLAGTVGDRVGGILSFGDSFGQLQVEVPVSAVVDSTAGLWVGNAEVTAVQHYLKAYQRGPNGPATTNNGQYVVTNINDSMGPVARTFPLRLIVHNPSNSPNAVLLQRVYVGLDQGTNLVVATRESALSRHFLEEARRISASHLPWSPHNLHWAFNGKLGGAPDLTASVVLGFDDHASNPFLHTYHPDHDGRDAQFQNLPSPGVESYTVRRNITLRSLPAAADFSSLTSGGQTIAGDYLETIIFTGLNRGATSDTRQFEVRGVFSLNRISDVPVLTTTP